MMFLRGDRRGENTAAPIAERVIQELHKTREEAVQLGVTDKKKQSASGRREET